MSPGLQGPHPPQRQRRRFGEEWKNPPSAHTSLRPSDLHVYFKHPGHENPQPRGPRTAPGDRVEPTWCPARNPAPGGTASSSHGPAGSGAEPPRGQAAPLPTRGGSEAQGAGRPAARHLSIREGQRPRTSSSCHCGAEDCGKLRGTGPREAASLAASAEVGPVFAGSAGAPVGHQAWHPNLCSESPQLHGCPASQEAEGPESCWGEARSRPSPHNGPGGPHITEPPSLDLLQTVS